jgi:YQGE family putative transporter
MDYFKNFQRPLKAFLLTKFFAYAQMAFAQFLINIYFWRITQSIPFLVLFNIVFLICHTLTYIPAGKIAKEYNRFLPMRIGAILQLIYLFLIVYLKGDIVHFIIPIAIIGGIGHGAYWFSDNLLKFDLTNPENRLKFTASYQIIQSIANSILPLLATILVVAGGGVFQSYARIFILAILFSLLVLVSSFFISKKNRFDTQKLALRLVSKDLWKDSNIRIACIGTALSYVSNMMPTLLGLLLFVSTGTELSIGKYQFITVLLVVITNFAMAKYLARKNYNAMLVWGGITSFLLVFILIISQSYLAIFLYGILTSLCSFLNSPVYPLSIDAFNMHCKDQAECVDKRVEYMILLEFFVCIGSLVSLLILLLLHTSLNPYTIDVVVILFAFADLVANLYFTRMKQQNYSLMDGLN